MADALYPNVQVLLQSFDSEFVDTSPNRRPLTFTGNGGIFSGGFDVNGGDWLDIAGGGFFFDGDFTMEFVARFNDVGVTQFLYTNRTMDPAVPVDILLDGASHTLHYLVNGALVAASPALAAFTNYNFTLSRVAGTLRAFLAGVQSGASVADANVYDTDGFRMGADSAGANSMVGRITTARLTGNVGRYAADFAPPALPFDAFYTTISGTLTDPVGSPASYQIRCYDRATGQPQGDAFSSSIDGTYVLKVKTDQEVTVVAFDGGADPLANDICIRVVPDPPP